MKIALFPDYTCNENPVSDADTDLDDDLLSEQRNVRCKRLLFRSWNRGTQESDLLLGSFADTSLTSFDNDQLDRFEGLLDCADVDLFDWIIGGSAPPPQHDHDVMHRLCNFWARPRRTARQHGS